MSHDIVVFFVYSSSPTRPSIGTWWRPVPVDGSSVVSLMTRPTATLWRCPSTATWQLAAPHLCPTLRRHVSFDMCVCVESSSSILFCLSLFLLYPHTQTHTHTHTHTDFAAIAISFWNQANWSHYHWSYFFYIFVSLVVSVWVQMCQRVPVCVCVSSHVYSPENHVALLLPLVATDVRWQNRDVIAASIDFIYKGERRKGGLCWRM